MADVEVALWASFFLAKGNEITHTDRRSKLPRAVRQFQIRMLMETQHMMHLQPFLAPARRTGAVRLQPPLLGRVPVRGPQLERTAAGDIFDCLKEPVQRSRSPIMAARQWRYCLTDRNRNLSTLC